MKLDSQLVGVRNLATGLAQIQLKTRPNNLSGMEFTPEVRGFIIDEDEPMRQSGTYHEQMRLVQGRQPRKSDLLLHIGDQSGEESSCLIAVQPIEDEGTAIKLESHRPPTVRYSAVSS